MGGLSLAVVNVTARVAGSAITGYQSESAMGKVTSGAPILEACAQHRKRVVNL
jgi:hypothetical protein